MAAVCGLLSGFHRGADGVSLSSVFEVLLCLLSEKAWRNAIEKAGYLNFWNNGAFLGTGAGEGRQRGWRHDGVGAGEVAQVTAGNLVLLVPHDDGLHDEEAIPGQPEGVLLRDEGRPLEPQDEGDAAVGDQVEAVWEGRVEEERRGKAGNRR